MLPIGTIPPSERSLTRACYLPREWATLFQPVGKVADLVTMFPCGYVDLLTQRVHHAWSARRQIGVPWGVPVTDSAGLGHFSVGSVPQLTERPCDFCQLTFQSTCVWWLLEILCKMAYYFDSLVLSLCYMFLELCPLWQGRLLWSFLPLSVAKSVGSSSRSL